MSIDILQERIRKTKNPSMVNLCLSTSDLPGHLVLEEGSAAGAYSRFCRELLVGLKGIVPAVRLSFASFALLGADGMTALTEILQGAKNLGFYVLLDAPEIYSPAAAEMVAQGIFGDNGRFICDGILISGYPGSDVIKPFLPHCKEGKDLFVVCRTANKSAPELQDLLTGGRLVHAAAADHVNRYGSDTAGKFGYTRVGIVAGASSAESLRNLRSKYPKLFMILDGADYPNANAKNCASGFDKFGHGAVACLGASVTGAWKQAEGSDGTDFVTHAAAAAERMRKNLTRYTTVL